jgi:hypothetical protein
MDRPGVEAIITEAMISAGASVLSEVSLLDLADGWLRPEEIVSEIYLAMQQVRLASER